MRNELEKHSIEVHNSRRPLSRLTVTLALILTFDLWSNIHWWTRYRDGMDTYYFQQFLK